MEIWDVQVNKMIQEEMNNKSRYKTAPQHLHLYPRISYDIKSARLDRYLEVKAKEYRKKLREYHIRLRELSEGDHPLPIIHEESEKERTTKAQPKQLSQVITFESEVPTLEMVKDGISEEEIPLSPATKQKLLRLGRFFLKPPVRKYIPSVKYMRKMIEDAAVTHAASKSKKK